MTIVDTNVIADVIASDPEWEMWSMDALARSRNDGPVAVNEVVFAEISARLSSSNEVNSILSNLNITFERIPKEGLFVAGQTYRRYRAAGGIRPNVLADFFIGAHARVTGRQVLTRDPRRYRTYFPDVRLITPP
jgi:predicted nucleic acid-binding protein